MTQQALKDAFIQSIMKYLYLFTGLLTYASTSMADPLRIRVGKRQAASATTPAGSELPTPVSIPSYTPTASIEKVNLDYKFSWQIKKTCSDADKATVKKAFQDSKVLSDALRQYSPDTNYQPAMDMYMGTRTTFKNYLQDPPYDFPLQINNTVTKHQGLYEGKSDRNAQLWVYCNEDSFWWGFCGKSNSPGAILAYEYEAAFSNYWYITFCPPFFDSDRTINLEDKMNELKDYNPEPDAIDSYHGPRMMRPYIFFHETMHMSQLITSPQAIDTAYGPDEVYDLAKNKNTDAAVYNADSWTMAALAIWAQNGYNLTGPPTPAKYLPNAASSAPTMTNANLNFDVEYVDASSVIPQGASAVPSDQSYYVDPNIWEIQDTAGGSTTPQPTPTASTGSSPPPFPSPSCNPNASGGFDLNAAITALGYFCTQQTATVQAGSQPISQSYPGGQGPGEIFSIRFTLSWDASQSGCPASLSPNQNDGRDCNTIFHSIVGGCPGDHNSVENAGGSVAWQCGYWSLGFDEGGPVLAPTTSSGDPFSATDPVPTPT